MLRKVYYRKGSVEKKMPGRESQVASRQDERKVILTLTYHIIIIIIIWFVRLLALRPLLAYCASLG
jgi:hypothetical protein